MKKVLLVFSLAFLVQLSAQEQDSQLNLERIYSSGEFRSGWFGQLRWFEDGNSYTTLTKNESLNGFNLVKTSTKTGKEETLVTANLLIPQGETKPLNIENYFWSNDKSKLLIFTNTKRVWRRNTKGDYWVLDLNTNKLSQLGGDKAKPSTLMFAKFSPDGNQVGFVREHNVYIENLSDGKTTPLTTDGNDKIINGTSDWAYEEEFGLRDGFRWSPDGSKIAYWRIDASKIRNFLMINNTDSVYSYTIPVQYPKAGEKPSEAKVGVVNVTGGATTWMNLPGDASNNYIPRLIWRPDSKALLVQHMNRAQNHNKVTTCNVVSGETRVVYEDKDTAWLEIVNDFKFMKDQQSFTWVSEKSGWKAAYSIKDGIETQISPSGIDMMSIELIDETGGWLYYIASPENASQRYLYRTKIDGKGTAQKISPQEQPGSHGYQISPNGKFARHTYSRAGVPTIIDLISLPNHKVIKTFVDNASLKAKVESLSRNDVEFFQVPARDGVMLDGYMMRPANFDPNKKYPVLFYVYGEPAGSTVRDSWGGSTYLWHLMFAQQGYIVMSIDNRGTPAPKGREWRKSVYGQIGVLSSQDQADALMEIKKKYDFVDGDRIGIWGWSGGGSMTLNMMFRYPDLYHTGMSVAPVPDQRLYDNIYQERYSGIPQLMPESYENGSPISHAKNLKGNLLVMHGTGDDNVHYQGTESLVNELIKYNKIFSMMSYPNRSHGIYEGENTSRHVREILTNYLNANLAPGGKEYKIESK